MPPKSDSFFIRATTDINNDNKYQESTIDLGAYVDALGKSVLRIHNIVVTMSDSTGRTSLVDSEAAAQFQLLTQSQATDIGSATGGIVLPSNRFVISSGRLCVDGASGVPTYVSTDFDNLPQAKGHFLHALCHHLRVALSRSSTYHAAPWIARLLNSASTLRDSLYLCVPTHCALDRHEGSSR